MKGYIFDTAISPKHIEKNLYIANEKKTIACMAFKAHDGAMVRKRYIKLVRLVGL